MKWHHQPSATDEADHNVGDVQNVKTMSEWPCHDPNHHQLVTEHRQGCAAQIVAEAQQLRDHHQEVHYTHLIVKAHTTIRSERNLRGRDEDLLEGQIEDTKEGMLFNWTAKLRWRAISRAPHSDRKSSSEVILWLHFIAKMAESPMQDNGLRVSAPIGRY